MRRFETYIVPRECIINLAHLISKTIKLLTCFSALDEAILKAGEDMFKRQPALIRPWATRRCAHAAKDSSRIRRCQGARTALLWVIRLSRLGVKRVCGLESSGRIRVLSGIAGCSDGIFGR